MAYEPNEGSGAMFPNNYKQDGDKKPDFKGNAKVNGVLVEIAGWWKDGAKGQFLSLKFQEPRQAEQSSHPMDNAPYLKNNQTSNPAAWRGETEDGEEDLPF